MNNISIIVWFEERTHRKFTICFEAVHTLPPILIQYPQYSASGEVCNAWDFNSIKAIQTE